MSSALLMSAAVLVALVCLLTPSNALQLSTKFSPKLSSVSVSKTIVPLSFSRLYLAGPEKKITRENDGQYFEAEVLVEFLSCFRDLT